MYNLDVELCVCTTGARALRCNSNAELHGGGDQPCLVVLAAVYRNRQSTYRTLRHLFANIYFPLSIVDAVQCFNQQVSNEFS